MDKSGRLLAEWSVMFGSVYNAKYHTYSKVQRWKRRGIDRVVSHLIGSEKIKLPDGKQMETSSRTFKRRIWGQRSLSLYLKSYLAADFLRQRLWVEP